MTVSEIGAELPVASVLPALLDGLARRSNAVLVAPPGAGKTTVVPLAMLDAAWRGDGRIIVLEPRRLAARAAAMRMSATLGEAVGGLVGYRTRVDRAVSARTRVEVVTEGLLVARLLGEPTLEGVAAVVFDEVHERTLDGDLALALCLDLQRSRPELRLLAMSATADADGLAALMDAAVHRSEGRMFAVDVRHATRDLGHVRELADGVARGVRAALAEADGDVLAFLPGKAEIGRAAAALQGCGAAVMALHGEMRAEEQAAVLRPGTGGRRVVLATSIAETSLTVPGVRTVVDGGFRRTPRLDAGSGLARLATLRISRAAADQRAGRAGREAPGRCLRLWTRASQRSMAPFDRPEMGEAELSGMRLALACWEEAWGTPPAALRFADAPPRGAWEAAEALLRDLGALDAAGAVTASGRGMAGLGTHPRLAAMMLSAGSAAEAAMAADLAALLEERDPLERDPGVASADVGLRLAAIGGDGGAVDRGAIGRIRDAAEGFRRRLRVEREEAAGDAAALLAAAFPDRIAQGRGEAGSFRLSGGGSASLPATDPLAREGLLVAAALQLGKSARITLAARLDAASLPDGLLARTTETVERGVDPRTGAVFNRSRRRLGALVLVDRLLPASAAEVAGHLAADAAGRLDAVLDWTQAARDLRARVGLARALLDPGLPDLSDAALAATAAAWLAPAIAAAGIGRLGELARLDLAALLAGRLAAGQRAALERELPAWLVLPRGRAAVSYTADGAVASARAQMFYGLDRTPVIAGGRVALTVSLLSPAGRPIAVTADLARFWRGGWADARRDMRGRYPRHDWPDEPWRA